MAGRALLIVALLVVAPVDTQSQSYRTVLAIHWSTEDFPSTQKVDAQLREALLSCPGMPVDYLAEYLESDRFPDEETLLATRDYIQRKFRNRPIAGVIASAEPALRFAITHRAELFPSAPITYLGVAPPEASLRNAGAGVTGVVSNGRFGETLALALKLHPATERVFVVAMAPTISYADTVRPELESVARGVELTIITAASVSELVAAIKAVPERSIVLYVRYSQESPGRVLFPSEVAALVSQASRVPVYTSADSAIGSGVIGGMVPNTTELARRAGEMTCQILNGKRAQDIPIESGRFVPTFDWRQLQRWRIDPALLPHGSVTLFKPATFWDLYRWYVAAALVLFATQALMIAALLTQRARRRKTEARHAAIMRAMPDMMFLQTRDGTYLDYYVPDGSELLAPPERFIGRNMRDVLPPELAKTFQEQFASLMQEKAPRIVEYTLTMPEGIRTYEARIVPCANNEVLSVVRDITARERAEAALSASEERHALATAAGGVGVWDWNLATNEMYIDPSLKAILGFDDDEISNHLDDWRRRVHPDDREGLMERAQAHLAGKTALYEMEHRMLHRDGSIRWFLTRGSAVHRNGVAVRITGTETDITERKKSEHALDEAQTELSRVSRLTALGEFAASIAHEVSQPLTEIVMNARACLRSLGAAAPNLTQAREALWDLIDASKRANEVIRRNRELFRHHIVQKAPLDVNAVIGEVAVLAGARLEASEVTLTTSLDRELPTIVGDPLELQQVLLNLILNAIDAMEGVPPGSRRVEIASALAQHEVQVSVRDNGVGLHGVDQGRMFTPAYTTKVNGTGVGLSISRSIVEAHGGRLWAASNEDRGATFFFTVPVPSARCVT